MIVKNVCYWISSKFAVQGAVLENDIGKHAKTIPKSGWRQNNTSIVYHHQRQKYWPLFIAGCSFENDVGKVLKVYGKPGYSDNDNGYDYESIVFNMNRHGNKLIYKLVSKRVVNNT